LPKSRRAAFTTSALAPLYAPTASTSFACRRTKLPVAPARRRSRDNFRFCSSKSLPAKFTSRVSCCSARTLTEENHREVLARAKHRTKTELERLVRRLNPLPDVPARVEPLGPAPHGIVANPTWARRVEAHSPEVRELEPGDRPKDWIADSPEDDGFQLAMAQSDPEPASPDPIEPQRYKVQFTATQEYVDLLEAARDLLAHAVPSRSIEEVHLRAMRALVAELKKKRTGATKKPQPAPPEAPAGGGAPTTTGDCTEPRQRVIVDETNPPQLGAHDQVDPRRRGRSVPRPVRRAVWRRDGARCSYVDMSGQRCRETACLELDHIYPHARGGPPTVENLRLRCRAHNALAAEYEFGRDFMASKVSAEAGVPREDR
jgi:hypothetical protein